MSANASYSVAAYGGAECAAANLIDTETFTTGEVGIGSHRDSAPDSNPTPDSNENSNTKPAGVSLAVAALSATSARLTIANHSGDWWYQLDAADSAAAAGCAAAGGTAARVSGLAPGTAHGITAYSAPDCAAGSKLATATLTTPVLTENTLPGLPAGSGLRPDLLSDLDSDGVTDFVEALQGTNPLAATSVDLSVAALDVLVLATAQAVERLDGAELEKLIEERADYANAAFAASGVRLRLRTGLAALPQTEESPVALLAGVAEGDSSALAELRALRARLGADLAVFAGLASEAGGACGMAYQNGADGVFGGAARAGGWSWIGLDCPAHWLARGVGHNLGLAHSRGFGGVFDFSAGHGAEGEFATIMADPIWWGVTEAQRVPVFSNPELDCGGRPCGVGAETGAGADAARSLNITGPLAAEWFLPQWPWPNALPASPGVGVTGEVQARIALGALSGGLYRGELRVGDTLDLVAEIEADPRHVGLAADFHLLVRDQSGRIAQFGADGRVAPWDETLDGLIPLRSMEALAAVERFYVVRGLAIDAALAGLEWEMFLAYSVGGELVYPAQPLRLRAVD